MIQTDEKMAMTITLPDGRSMGYAIYGDPEGYPIFIFHGTPGSRIWFQDDDPVAKDLGLCLIATDRPGYGLSDPKKDRQVLDYPNDIAALADHLNINSFSVMGASGGSAYAAACAYALPNRINVLALVASIDQFKDGKAPKGMCTQNRISFWLARNFPFILRWSLNKGRNLIHKAPEKYIQIVQAQVSHLCESDRIIMQKKDAGVHVYNHIREAFRQNVREAVSEPALLSKPWNFNIKDIQVPVHLWHGTEDTLAPIAPVKTMSEKIANCTTHFIEGKGHFLDYYEDDWRKILESMIPESNAL